MKLTLLLFILNVFSVFGQVEPPKVEYPSPPTIPTMDDSIILFIHYDDPQFPGGVAELKRHFQSYSFDASLLDSSDYRRGYVSFIVEKDGRLMDIQIVRGISPELDDIMLRMVEEMPRWIPMCDRDNCYRARVRIPITFTATDE